MMSELKIRQRLEGHSARNAQMNRAELSRIICERFTAQEVYFKSKTVMWYVGCNSEVITQPALLATLSTEKRTVIPYCTKDDKGQPKLGLWHLEDLSELIPGTWNIPEPPKIRWGDVNKEVAPEHIDLIMVPGVAFDRRGGRIGNGAGYYDRFLANVRSDAVLCGVCFESQVLRSVTMEEHDIRMDYVLTEKMIYNGLSR